MNALLLAAVLCSPAASADSVIDAGGVSHVDWLDRRPRCPVDGESFVVYLHALAGDLDAVRVRFDDGTPRWIDAQVDYPRGVYEVWSAALPCTSPTGQLQYFFELSSGSAVLYLGPASTSGSMPASGWLVDYATLSHAPFGATPATSGVVFKVWAAGAGTAHVVGTFNNWNNTANPMSKAGDVFTTRIANARSGQTYKYRFNNSLLKPDARAQRLNPSDSYNTIIPSPHSYAWQSTPDFRPPFFEDMIVYQLHVGTFSGRNDGANFGSGPASYRAVVDVHLQHLLDLGINVVQLMPVNEYPTDWSGGYNPVNPWSVESSMGTVDDFKYMVDKLHQAGIAVTVDIIWNHVSSSDNYLWQYTGTTSTGQIYFDGFNTGWGPQADLDRAEVQDYYADSALYWLNDLRLDGFRMDATDYMNPPNGQAGGWDLMRRMNNELNRRFVNKIAYAEELPDDYRITRSTAQGGAGFDAQYHDEFKLALRDALSTAGSGGANLGWITNAIQGHLNDGTYITAMGGSLAQLFRYFELHDEVWTINGRQRMVKTLDPVVPHDDAKARGMTLVAHAITMFSPGIPAFFMGSEFLEDTAFNSSSSNRLDWSKVITYADYLQAFKDMIRTRKQHRGLRGNGNLSITHVNEGVDVFAMRRWDGAGSDVMVVVNFANTQWPSYLLGFPQGGVWREAYNTQSAAYGGSGITNGPTVSANGAARDGFGQSVNLTLPGMSVLVFVKEVCTSNAQCNDSIACTVDACVQGVCVSTPDHGACPDDGVFCNGVEYCAAGQGCVSSGDACPGELCDELLDRCTFTTDFDSDGLADACDNCPLVFNADQQDTDQDGQGDVCEGDDDGDGVPDASDNCPLIVNAGQADGDLDGVGDACDQCPGTPVGDLVDAQGCALPIPGDFDGDRDVDLDDYAEMQRCYSGNVIPAAPDCLHADLDQDVYDDVDSADLDLFLQCLQGPDLPVRADCAD